MFRHCTMDELLELRDGRGTEASRRHVTTCGACGHELERLHQRRAALKALPSLPAPRGRWAAIRDGYVTERRAARRRWAAWTGLAAAAAVLLVAGVALVGPRLVPGDDRAALDSLVLRSEQLDLTLQQVGAQRRVMDGLTALTIAELEDRVWAVDSAIGSARTTSLPQTELRDLWSRRVNLMEVLVTSHVQSVSYVGF
jgi:hypothetical protein